MASFFQKMGRAITRPVRGVGRVVRGTVTGDFDLARKGIGDIGHGAKIVAPIALGATGAGLPLALGVGAAGGAAERIGERGANLGTVTGAAVRGAATGAAGYGAGKLARGVGEAIVGGAGAPPPVATGTHTLPGSLTDTPVRGGMDAVRQGLMERISGGASLTRPAFAPSPAPGFASRIGSAISNLSMPQAYLASQALGTTAQAVGQGLEASAIEKEEARRRRIAQSYAPIFGQLIASQMPRAGV